MKYIIGLLLLVFVGCKSNSYEAKHHKNVLDSTSSKTVYKVSVASIDSNNYYLEKELMAYKMNNEYHIKYLTSYHEKDRIMANKYIDSNHYWYNLLRQYMNKNKP